MKKIYKYTLGCDYTYYDIVPVTILFNNKWLNIVQGDVTISKGYSWDGCSPKFKLFNHIVGTPDGNSNQTKFASCVHDVLYQFKPEGVLRHDVDLIFLNQLVKAKWSYSTIYYLAVRMFGWMSWNNNK